MGNDITEVAVIETLHIAHVLEQLVRGYLTGGNSNRWRTHVLSNVHDPPSKNVKTFFYRFEFQQRETVYLHMLVWLEDVSSIRADVMYASVPWDNAHDAFLVANTQKSHKPCLPVKNGPDAFVRSKWKQHAGIPLHRRQRAKEHTRIHYHPSGLPEVAY